jgi:Tol biopolymer transport system component
MSLDHLARIATEELLDKFGTDPGDGLAALKRLRRRRNVERTAAITAAVALVGGGWLLAQRDTKASAPEPVDHHANVRDATIVAGGLHRVAVAHGDVTHLPSDAVRWTNLAFTPDGMQLLYENRDHDVASIDVSTGTTRTVMPCGVRRCSFELAADGDRIALPGRRDAGPGVVIRSIKTGEESFVPTPGLAPAMLTWSPTGDAVAFVTQEGLYTVGTDGTEPRWIAPVGSGSGLIRGPAWSPNGDIIAYIDQAPAYPGSPDGSTHAAMFTYTLKTVRPDGSDPRTLRGLGSCVCLGLAPPAITWSPDGSVIAATTLASGSETKPSRATEGPIVLVSQDGSVEQTEWSSHDNTELAWQPTPDR